jgi:hypothetical protein
MSVAARNDAAVSFVAWMRQYEYTMDMSWDDPRRYSVYTPKIASTDYTDFVNGAAILRGLCQRGKIDYMVNPLSEAMEYAQAQLDSAIERKDWGAAKAWLRPGIAYRHKTYDEYERQHPLELGETVRQGRADGLRQEFWCVLVKDAIPRLSWPSEQPYMHTHMTFCALRALEALNRKYPLDKVALEDDRFGDGTVLEVWLRDVGPHLTHLRPEFARYERELRSRSSMPFDARLALAEGLHARLGASSNVGRLTSELAQMIVNSDAMSRGPVHLLPPERKMTLY